MGSGSVVAQTAVSAVDGVSGQPHALATLPTKEERQGLLDVLKNIKVLAAGFEYYVMGLFSFNSEKRTRN